MKIEMKDGKFELEVSLDTFKGLTKRMSPQLPTHGDVIANLMEKHWLKSTAKTKRDR